MTLGTSRPRNWGKESQQIALDMLIKRRRVAYRTQSAGDHLTLWLTPSHGGITLPYTESVADLVNVRRGRWEARHPFDGRLLATGISLRDVVRATIQEVWH